MLNFYDDWRKIYQNFQQIFLVMLVEFEKEMNFPMVMVALRLLTNNSAIEFILQKSKKKKKLMVP